MIQVFSTAELLADGVARHVAGCAEEAISKTGRFTLALSGGSTPRAAYSRLATGDLADQIDWQRTHVVWGDERCVPPDDPRSNFRMAKEALLRRVPIPADQVHRIRGEDGHTASLFPGQPTVHETKRWVTAVLAPDRNLWRVTLTPPVINAARNVTFVVSGTSKAAPLRQVLEGPYSPDLLPAQAIRPVHGRLTWMTDEAAAARLRTQRAST